MLRDSPNEVLAGLIFAIMAVLEFPPKLSFSNLSREITILSSGLSFVERVKMSEKWWHNGHCSFIRLQSDVFIIFFCLASLCIGYGINHLVVISGKNLNFLLPLSVLITKKWPYVYSKQYAVKT